MFEITGDEISELNDVDLRSLVGLLCEADLQAKNLPTAGVTWGGHQNAMDGGLDVQVQITASLDPDGFIPRTFTGFQVKQTDMPRSKIIEEMRPDGELRGVITDLIEAGGAYIIVSGMESTSPTALRNRRNAMDEALSGIENASNLKLDFYDRGRLASWVRNHHSLVLWVRERIGKAIQGWRPFDNWANSPGGVKEEYLLDDEIRILDGANIRPDGMNAVDGINHLRNILIRPASSVRLTGLSGVGKTRLVQALFDQRIGNNPLNPAQVFYTDVSYGPSPNPRNFAERLVASGRPAIMIVDNCPPDLHRLLTSLCTASGSLISLITIEYDVREDQPEETAIFRLEPASIQVIEKMIRRRFTYISQVDARTIAEFSGGNARIAIVLANTIKKGESLADLRDEDLFQRLFYQRTEPNNNLLHSAEVCSLVYSFDVRTAEDSNIELRLLGSLAGRTVNELFRDVAEMKRKEVVQQRNFWRAVLPQALANRLAQRAFQNIPIERILDVFINGGSLRLLKSFSRRLGYLHRCPAAVEIAQMWLSENGLLSDIHTLDDLGITLLRNIAPIAPEAALTAIERSAHRDHRNEFVSRNNKHANSIVQLLRSLAYDPILFDRCVDLLCRFALTEEPAENYNSIREVLKSLFFIYLSGTHASPEMRLRIIERLVNSHSNNEQNIGLLLLEAALKSSHFTSHSKFDFGAQSRDYGYFPKTREEVIHWFNIFVDLAASLALSDQAIAAEAKSLIAQEFMELWVYIDICDKLEEMAKLIIRRGPWNEGWTAVRTTIKYHAKGMDSGLLSRLQELEKLLKPDSLLELSRVYGLSCDRHSLDLADAEEDDVKPIDLLDRVEKTTIEIGRKVAENEAIFGILLPEILTAGSQRIHSFAQGLAEGSKDPFAIWQAFCQQLIKIDSSQHNYQALRGFLYSLSKVNPEACEQILEDALNNEILSAVFPLLQTSVAIGKSGVQRIIQSLEKGDAPIWTYKYLGYAGAHKTISDEDLCNILNIIASKPDGLFIAIDILNMRLFMHKREKLEYSDVIKNIGKDLLNRVIFDDRAKRQIIKDHELGEIAEACLDGPDASAIAKIVCDNLANAISNHNIYVMDCSRLLINLARKQPLVFLDTFLKNNEMSNSLMAQLFRADLKRGKNPLSHIPNGIIISWCEKDPVKRYPIMAAFIPVFKGGKDETPLEWTPLSLTLIDNAPDVVTVLNKFKRIFRPMSWSGSRAEIMQKRLSLISNLKSHKDRVVSEWAYNEEREFEKEIRIERDYEEKKYRSRDERFEY